MLPPLVTTVFTTKPTGGHTSSTCAANSSEGNTAHKEANISGWIIVPTPTQLSKQHSPSRTSNTSNQSIRTPSTCAAKFSEGKMVLTYSVLAQLSQQNFLHFNPTDRHTSTCASNISEGKMALTYSVYSSNTSNQPIDTGVPVQPTFLKGRSY